MVEKNEKKNEAEDISENEVEPFIGETPTVVINGKSYKMRRLGMADTFKLFRIIGIGAAGIGKELSSLDMTPETAIALLIVGFPYAADQILDLFASLLGIKPEEIRKPAKFPMGSEVAIIKALVEHVDAKAFFIKLAELAEIPALKEFLKKMSTSSKKDMDGQTKK